MQDPSSPSPATAKRALRDELRRRRAALAPCAGSPAAAEAGAAAARLLLSEAGFTHACQAEAPSTVALYLAFGHEFDAAPIGAAARGLGAALAYPRVAAERRLVFHTLRHTPARPGLDPADRLVRGAFGVLEPAPDEPVAGAIDLFIVPGLGFDRAGHRLGYGAGFYDGALRAHPAALRIALSYPFQLLPAIPHDEHDEPMDLIATPDEVVHTGARHLLPQPAIKNKEDLQ